ncbi:unnamed protein product, partial [Rotaria sp. Silwood1]
MIQPICPIGQISPPPFLLAAYGTNSFSADCDPKQMKAMRDSMGFEEHPNRFEISLLR